MILKRNHESQLDTSIAKVHSQLDEMDISTEAATTTVKNLSKLYKLKPHEAPSRVSPDTIAVVAGNLAGILIIVGYERMHVASARALGLVMKTK